MDKLATWANAGYREGGLVFHIRVHALGVAVLPAGLVWHSVQDGAELVAVEARIL